MHHYLMLVRANFYTEQQNSNKVLPFGAMGSIIMPHRVPYFDKIRNACFLSCLSEIWILVGVANIII